MPHPSTGHWKRAIQRHTDRRDQFGTPFILQRDGKTYYAVITQMSQNEDPAIRMEAAADASLQKMILLDKLPDNCPIEDNDLITYPVDGDPRIDRYRISNRAVPVDDRKEDGTGVVIRRQAIGNLSPDTA